MSKTISEMLIEALEEIRRQAGAGVGAVEEDRLGKDGACGDFEWIIDRAKLAIEAAKPKEEQA